MLKIKTQLFFFFFLTALGAQAQSYKADILLGANFSQIDGDQFAGYNKLGLNLGFAINRTVKGPWDASFEILYTQKGSRKVLDPDIIEPSLVINYHYIELPLLARYALNDKVQFYAGPSFGINVFNERDDNGFIKKEEALNKTEVAMHLGGSYAVSDHFALDLRHSYSILSIRDFPIIVNSPTWFGRAGWYNRLFTIGVRYRMGQ
jgi:opacity protein-like surface antigen